MKKHLFWPGLALWIAGIVVWLITGNLSPVSLALIFGGIALIISRFASKAEGFWSFNCYPSSIGHYGTN